MFPDVKQRTMELALNILRKGNTEGFESDFQNMFELTLDFLADVPGGFSNFETSDKSLEVKAESMKIQREKRNKFKTLRNATCEFCLSNFYNKQAKERHIENVHQHKEKFNRELLKDSRRAECMVFPLIFLEAMPVGAHLMAKG